MTPAVSAVLITRERALPAAIAASVARFPFAEVLVETACPGVHRRYALAAQAASPIVYVQDDDATIDVAALFAHWTGDGPVYAITPRHHAIYDALCGSRVFLLGWGCFFPRAAADPARWQPFVDRFGPIPSHEADRVFTYFAGPARPVHLPIRHYPRPRAMSRDNPHHYRSRDRIVRQLCSLALPAAKGSGQ